MSDTQQQMIREAMKAIAERRPGRTKLVYDKSKRTIVAVSEHSATPRALNITADDADMFAILTLSARWLSERWQDISIGKAVEAELSVWDGGDALTHCELGVQPSAERVTCKIGFGVDRTVADGGMFASVEKSEAGDRDKSVFVAPDKSRYRLRASDGKRTAQEQIDVVVAYVQPELELRRSGLL